MKTISAVIITRNESTNIARCLESIREIADEIIVVDSGSTDSTKDICLSYGVKFVYRDWSGYGDQKNFGNAMAISDYILSIDADEALSETLRNNILKQKKNGFQAHAYSFNRITNYCGQWIKHGGWYPDIKTRIWKNGIAKWKGNIHETLVLEKEGTLHLKGDLLHYSYPDMETHIQRSIYYAQLGAEKMYVSGKQVSIFKLIYGPAFSFFRKYFLKLGFLDGYYGFVIAKNASFYNFYKYALLRSYHKQNKSVQP